MSSFKQRIGIDPIEKAYQISSIDADLRRELWDLFYTDVFQVRLAIADSRDARDQDLYWGIHTALTTCWSRVLNQPADEIPVMRQDDRPKSGIFGWIRNLIFNGDWADVYELFDTLAQTLLEGGHRARFISRANSVLERNNSAYRFVGTALAPITSKLEIECLANSINSSTDSVRTHLSSALSMLGDRLSPDYRNSIKESISAVEAACKAISGKPKATLGMALSELQKHRKFNGALIEAFNRLYGYTNDASQGIRHALSDQAEAVNKADAQFMLIACSAFINYITSVSSEQVESTKPSE